MKTKLFLLAVVTFFCQMIYAEYAIIGRIAYHLDFENLTATVLNFQVDTDYPCDVTIPERVFYKKDIYKVTRFSYYAFDYDAVSNYQMTSLFLGSDLASLGLNGSFEREKAERDYRYNYKEARANIEHIELPQTLEVIDGGAFVGMRRLKSLIIPASVKKFANVKSGNLLNGSRSETFPRLETITILGTPTCEAGYYLDNSERVVSVAAQVEQGDFDYIKMMAYVVAGIDTLTNSSVICPKLRYFNMPRAKAAIEKAQNNRSWCNFYNARLETICADYNTKLKEHVFYDGTILTYENVQLSENIDYIKKSYNLQKDNIFSRYNTLIEGKMEENLRNNDKVKYLNAYSIAYPDKKHFIDSLLLEFRCHNEAKSYDVIIDAIGGKSINLLTCRQEQYLNYAYYFKDQTEFNERYNLAASNDDFMKEIRERKEAKKSFEDFNRDMENNPNVNLQGMFSSNDKKIREYLGHVCFQKRKCYYYDDAINVVISINKNAKKEYEKNGQYFASPKEFFEAYISSQYKAELKKHKQQVK